MSLDAMKQAYVALHNAYEGRLKTGEMLRAMTALRHAIYEVDAISPTPIEDWPRQWQGLTEEEIEQMMDYWSEDARSAYGGAHSANGEYVYIPDIIRDVEKRLKEKNDG